MQLEKKVEDYLKDHFGCEATLKGIERLGKGVHGTAFRIKFNISNQEKRLIIKTLFPSGFGHDHYSDRAQVLLLAHAVYNEMPNHVRAVDVVGEKDEGFISVKDTHEFYLLMEESHGESYFSDLDAILERGRLTNLDREKAVMLGRFLAKIHREAYNGENRKTLYRRRIRNLIGHGECIMGIIDSYNSVDFTTDQELVEYAGKCLAWWGKIRDKSERLCNVHGDFHPGNIRFWNKHFTVLDRSRGQWGEPADDVSCLAINYIYYAIKDNGSFKGSFTELFRLFMNSYLEETRDDEFFEVIQPFFAFRVLVIANPKFYPEETSETRRKLLGFGQSVLETEKFDTEKIPSYLER
jgi:aminoglycoside phosphotransferase family enzyme